MIETPGDYKLENEKYRVIKDSAPDAVLIYDVDKECFIDFNDNILRLLKYKPEELRQMNPMSISPPYLHGKNVQEYAMSHINAALSGKSPYFEWIHIDAEGTEIPCEVRLVKFPPFEKNIVAAGIVDQREKIRFDNLLLDHQERLKLTLESTQLACFDWDEKEGEIHWDDRMYEMLGITKKPGLDLVQAFFDVLSKPEKKHFLSYYTDLLNSPEDLTRYQHEFSIIRNGEQRDLVSNGSIIRDKLGFVERIIGTLKDVTEERQASREHQRLLQLEARNKELEQFAYVASHDLQEPLRTVIGFINLLEDKDLVKDAGKRYMSYIKESTTRMSNLISGLLDYTRIGQHVNLEKVDCNMVLKSVLSDLALQISEAEAMIHHSKLPEVKGRPTELRVLFQNLLSNAIKYRSASRKPQIYIDFEKHQHEYIFYVRDNGIGIEPRHHRKVFIIFQRLHPGIQNEGSGIGLAYCQKIVEAHGGRIWLDSEAGKGSTFYFSLPIG